MLTKPVLLKTIPAAMASLSMVAAPASAAQLPVTPAVQTQSVSADVFGSAPANADAVWSDEAVTTDWFGYRGFGRYGRYRHRNRVDAGDVIAGVLIIGGIAAIASAASNNNNRNRRSRDVDYRRDREVRSDDRRGNARSSAGSSGLDRAVSMCRNAIERDVRIDSVDGVTRTGSGWTVTGAIFNGTPFTCQIGPDGQIDRVDYALASNAPANTPVVDRQYDDSRYQSAWNGVEGNDRDASNSASNSSGGENERADTRLARAELTETGQQARQQAPQVEQIDTSEALPAYPGAPVDGDLND
jgi:hypothetical protein